jgi:glycosyltransferase involved in cell wall biosynthesis
MPMTAEPLVTVIIPLRNRGGHRLDNCLRSLRWQDLPAEQVELLVSDFGSDAPHRATLEPMAAEHDVRVVWTDTREIWNRARALNFGIRAARGRYVLCTDADMIFAPSFLSAVLAAQREANDAALVVCRCRNLPSTVEERPYVREEFPALLEASTYRERLGTGACQMALRGMFHTLRGFDEGYKFWGLEDTDMTFRAQRQGLRLAWVHERTAMLHQWHPTDRNKRPLRKFFNDARFHLTKYVRRKNPGGWGGGAA